MMKQIHKLIAGVTFPKIGRRTVKSLAASTLVALLYSITDRNPCFACIGAVYGMGSSFQGGLQSGGNRFIGTLIGGILAIPFYWLIHLSGWPIPEWIWLLVGLFFVLYIHQMFGATSAIQPGTVVFFVVIETVAPERYISYTIARVIDTGIGVVVALLINKLFPNPPDAIRLAPEIPPAQAAPAEQVSLVEPPPAGPEKKT